MKPEPLKNKLGIDLDEPDLFACFHKEDVNAAVHLVNKLNTISLGKYANKEIDFATLHYEIYVKNPKTAFPDLYEDDEKCLTKKLTE